MARSSGTTKAPRSTQGLTRENTPSSRGEQTTTSLRSPGTISERSTLQSFRETSTGPDFRGGSNSPNEPNYSTDHYTGGSTYHWGGSYYGDYSYGHYHPYYYYSGWNWGWGLSFGWGWGGFHVGWLAYNYPGVYYYPQYYYNHHSYGHLLSHGGWCGYNWGGYCSYWPSYSWGHRHCFSYHGTYFYIGRPYWYGYSRWYDYSPYHYSYTSLVYDSLYDEGYDDGYDRGYEDGAEDASGYKDDRRRDKIGGKSADDSDDDGLNRADSEADEEFAYEMNRGAKAFGKGDYKTATKAFKEAVILSPNSADARFNLAVAAFAEGKYSFSAFALRRGVSLDATRGNIDLVAAFGDPVVLKDHLQALDAELADKPEDADLLLVSGYVALRAGNASQAADRFDRAVKAAPDDEAAKALQREAMEALEKD